jgi:TRAP-type C4-dicarboxylate transport system substrate-binding protein
VRSGSDLARRCAARAAARGNDGVLAVLPVLAAIHYYDSAKYITETNLSFAVRTLVLSKTWFDRLPPYLQKIVAEDTARIGDEMHQ